MSTTPVARSPLRARCSASSPPGASTPDDALGACARTVAEALARLPAIDGGGAGFTADAVPAFASDSVGFRAGRERGNVRCADCRHFARSATHPRLGRCGAGELPTAAGGWWDTQPRACGSFHIGF